MRNCGVTFLKISLDVAMAGYNHVEGTSLEAGRAARWEKPGSLHQEKAPCGAEPPHIPGPHTYTWT